MSKCIKVLNLNKTFRFPIKDSSKNWFQNTLSPQFQEKVAVSNISFDVEYGERIAFIGPNGAGKSTTIKMLTGILYPTSGKISVLGLNPQEDRNKLSYQIGTVFGQRSQLLPNLPFTDTMELFGVMYDLTNKETQKRISELI